MSVKSTSLKATEVVFTLLAAVGGLAAISGWGAFVLAPTRWQLSGAITWTLITAFVAAVAIGAKRFNGGE